MPVVASNRVGQEKNEDGDITFYGTSFVADQFGAVVAEAGRDREAVIAATFDLDAIQAQCASWSLFRDRRPDLYGGLVAKSSAGRPA